MKYKIWAYNWAFLDGKRFIQEFDELDNAKLALVSLNAIEEIRTVPGSGRYSYGIVIVNEKGV